MEEEESADGGVDDWADRMRLARGEREGREGRELKRGERAGREEGGDDFILGGDEARPCCRRPGIICNLCAMDRGSCSSEGGRHERSAARPAVSAPGDLEKITVDTTIMPAVSTAAAAAARTVRRWLRASCRRSAPASTRTCTQQTASLESTHRGHCEPCLRGTESICMKYDEGASRRAACQLFPSLSVPRTRPLRTPPFFAVAPPPTGL